MNEPGQLLSVKQSCEALWLKRGVLEKEFDQLTDYQKNRLLLLKNRYYRLFFTSLINKESYDKAIIKAKAELINELYFVNKGIHSLTRIIQEKEKGVSITG